MEKEKSVSEKIKWIAEIITAIGVISGLGYGIGRWQSHMEHKTEMGIVVAAFAALVIYLCAAARKKKKAVH